MKKNIKSIFVILTITLFLLNYTAIIAVPAAPPDGGGTGGAPGGNRGSANVSYNGATTISSDTNNSGSTYSSSTGSQNALLVSGGTSTLANITVTKSGDASGDNADFYGTNAGVLAYNGATLNINGGNISTNGSHANAVFAYGTGVINISDAAIKTSNNNSGAVMVTGGGKLTANNITATTDGNSSAPIRSDRGGGNLTVNGGEYTANGVGSPAIYSTADITVNNSTLTSTSSEGAVVEGKNSITLNNTNLTDTNTSLNGNSETYKNIFLYQSMSGDADEGTASFTANNSTITTNKGDTIFVTNTTATVSLENNKIVNNDSTGAFLRIQTGKWGNSGSNGGNVTLNASNQEIIGDIYVDNISSLDMKLTNNSNYSGTINGENKAKNLSINLNSGSVLTLTSDSYITSLSNELEDNSNINLNGHTLYVGNNAITSTNYKEKTNDNAETSDIVNSGDNNITNKYVILIVICIVVVIIVLGIVIAIIKKTKNNVK